MDRLNENGITANTDVTTLVVLSTMRSSTVPIKPENKQKLLK